MDENLNHYLSRWKLSDPQLLAQTPTSHVYTVTRAGDTLVLKLLTEYGWEEQRGAAALRHYDGHGAVRLYAADEHAQLLEYASGDDLISLVERGDDTGATRIIAEVLNQLHGVAQGKPADGVFPLKDWFRSLFARAASEDNSIFARAVPVAERLLNAPRDVRVLHGDVHHGNIRQSARGWLAFDPKGLVGERTYDCANTLCNPFRGQPGYDPLVHNEQRLLTNAGILADTLGIEFRRVLAFTYAYACLSASWSLDARAESHARWALNIAQIIEPHLD
ncbi:MAG: 3'-kinase [Chloroflexi bacterium]|nr:3'-kinase [Chloroflexota bacterium]